MKEWKPGSKNLVGAQVRTARLYHHPPLTQTALARMLSDAGVTIDRIAISRIETGDRTVTDIELLALSQALERSVEWMLSPQQISSEQGII